MGSIKQQACQFFQQLLTQDEPFDGVAADNFLCYIPSLVTESDNLRLLQPCTMDEVKRAVELLDQDSAAGADGYTGRFYRSCWDIIYEDLLQAVHEFMAGVPIPRSVASTLL